MSSHSSSVSAFERAEPKPSIFADKARLRRFLMIWGVVLIAAISAFVYLTGGRYVGTDDSTSTPTS